MLLISKTATGDPSINVGLQLFCMKKIIAFDLLTCLHKQSYKQNVIMSKENMCFVLFVLFYTYPQCTYIVFGLYCNYPKYTCSSEISYRKMRLLMIGMETKNIDGQTKCVLTFTDRIHFH